MESRIAQWSVIVLAALGLSACGDDDTEADAQEATLNAPPTISGTPRSTVTEGELYSFTPVASDADGDPIIFGIDGKPGWLSFDQETGRLFGTPGAGDVGLHRGIVVWVSDGEAETPLPTIDIEVLPAGAAGNSPPMISGTPDGVVIAGDNYDFIPTVFDADGDALSFEVRNAPSWATFDATIGRLFGTPGGSDVGSYGDITISVDDGVDSADLGPFVIVVNPPPQENTPPVISGLPADSVTAGEPYAFTPNASDADGDVLSFEVFNSPGWTSFDVQTGTLSGTPSEADVGVHAGIMIVVSDGESFAALPEFDITVTSANSPPTISGTPFGSVVAGQAYAFTPTASDPDDDPLSFSIANQPVWASFDSSTGALTGTPGSGDVGTYGNISITVSDGNGTDSIGPFSIAVTPIANGSATLSWTPPNENTDGSPLLDLAGYVVYWGTSSGSYANSVTINDAGITTYIVDNLTSGMTYYFVATAFNSQGLESSFSNEASKTIP